jgi:hypothetical protein
MAPLLFQLRAFNSDVDADILTFFSYSEDPQSADMTIFREIPLADFKGILVNVNKDQFDPANPEDNDLNIKFSPDFFEGPLKDLFSNNTFEIVTGTTSVNTTQFANAQYIQTILDDQNFIIENWEELVVSGLIDKIIGYKSASLVSNEDAVVATLSSYFNNAINQKLVDGKTMVSSNGVFTEYGLAEEIGNELKNSGTNILKKVLANATERLTPALNSAGTYVDYNTCLLQPHDLIEILINGKANYNQTLLDGTYYSGDSVVVRVILKLV